MKQKRIILIAIAIILFLCSSTMLAASDKISAYLFKGKLVVNNQMVDLKQDVFNINGSVYVPLRAFTDQLRGHVSYNKDEQTIYVEQSTTTTKKSTVNAKDSDNIFTLHAFASKSEYEYGEPIEIWARLSNDTDRVVNIWHGPLLINYYITDEDGFTSHVLAGLALESSTFQAGDELNKSLGRNDFLVYHLNKIGFDNIDDVNAYLNNADRPSMLPPGEYTITVKAEYKLDDEVEAGAQWHTLEASIPLTIQ
ncbi:stalk domain-containing protein [Paenibacillus camelliae]|uniref:stalk domain-containing protein n=1 Tax=Paenibacillus camelliae TaxID=512410 RepID=UPI00203C1C86|nr:stalk domain-containing protein [Paenibacillus camelliae]MCM3634116.1 copper amine oxidase N-terminal domain-containing protein [Paenibacillus camelliae]